MEVGNQGLEQIEISKRAEELHLSIMVQCGRVELVETSSLHQGCFVNTGMNACIVFSDYVVPTHLQLLCFRLGSCDAC